MIKQLKLPFYLTMQYIRRGRKWTLLLTIFLMTVAFINLIFTPSLFNGIIDGSNKQIINTLTSDVYVSPPNGSDYINQTDQVINQLSSINGVKAVSSKTSVPARLKYKNISGSWQIFAINLTNEENVSIIPKKIFSGTYLSPNDIDQVVIGRQIAGGKNVEKNALSFKDAKVGDKVTLIFDGVSKVFTIKGIYNTGFVQADERAFITNKALENIIPTINNKSTVINIKINHTSNEGKVINTIEKRKVNVNVYSWQDSTGLMKSVSNSFLSINVLLSFTSVMIAAVTIVIIIYVTIINKRKEIGILRAIGIKPYIIVFSYVILSVIYALVGVMLGTAVFFFILVPYFQAHPFVLPICDAVLVLNWADYIIRAEAIIGVSIIGGFIPAVVVTRAKMLNAILGK
jgi:putative ABC transport system permease protein